MRRKILLFGLVATAMLIVVWLAQTHVSRPLSLVWKTRTGMHLWYVQFMPDSKSLIGGNPHQIVLWDAATGQQVVVYPTMGPYELDLSPNGRYFASVVSDVLELWDLSSRRKLWSQCTKQWVITKVAFSPDGRYVATCDADRLTIKLWRVSDGKLFRVFWVKGLFDFAFSPKGKLLATAEEAKIGYIVRLWDLATKRCVGMLKCNHRAIGLRCSIGFSPDGQTLVVQEEDGFRLWDVERKKSLGIIPSPVPVIFAWHPTGKFLAIADYLFALKGYHWHGLRIVRTKDLQVVATRILDWRPCNTVIVAIDFSPDGKKLVVGCHDGTVWLFHFGL